ncbi:ATP-binding protein [uncultured Herbaspirillum sp.]|uniref:PAS domain-containing sensor histidine kinase n=1 Tax=uncultured Herbaspirillum sp. TaxID=160236 RepID=UPI0025886C5B|nr:ATP-binding protein [uncultured Herbaspirillum sp.]
MKSDLEEGHRQSQSENNVASHFPWLPRATLDSIDSQIALIDRAGVIHYVNKAWCDFGTANGMPPQYRWIGTSYLAACRSADESGESDGGHVYIGIKSVIDSEVPFFQYEYPCHSPNEQRWFMMRIAPVLDAESFFVISHSVITERVIANHRLKAQQLELKRSNDELLAFAYVASHDLKSPLRGIGQLATWIKEDLAERNTTSIEEHLHMMQQRIARMDKLLDDLLLYSRVGRSELLLADMDAYDLVRQIYDSYLPVSTFTLHLEGQNFPIRTCQPTLEQVLRNLMSNAVKHHDRPQGTITVAVRRLADDLAEFTVADDGPGIDPTFHQRVFQMFQTLRPRDEIEGSGIGLALVKKLVENAGGKISLLSNAPIQRGCTFMFTWPIAPTLRQEL